MSHLVKCDCQIKPNPRSFIPGSERVTMFQGESQMAARPLVVICGPDAPGSALEKIVSEGGYSVTRVEPAEHIVDELDDYVDQSTAFLLDIESDQRAAETLGLAANAVPSARFVVFSSSEVEIPEESISSLDGADEILWIGNTTNLEDTLGAIRCFLQADGYLWASQLEPDHSYRLFLSDGLGKNKEGTERTKWLGSFVERLSSYSELDPMLAEALRGSMEALECEAGSVYLWDEQKETLVLQVAEGPDKEQRRGLRQKLGEGLAGWVAEVGEAILVTDANKVDRLQDRERDRYPDPSCLACPLMHGDKLLGVLCLTMHQYQQPFQPPDLRLARDIAQEVGSVMSPLCVMSELRALNEKLMGLFRRSSDFLVHKAGQLAEARALSADVLQAIPLGVIAYDERLQVRSTNSAARQFIDGETSLGNQVPLEDQLLTEKAEWRRMLRKVVSAGETFRLRRARYCTDDGEIHLDIHGAPLHTSDGDVIGGILTIQDVTKDVEMAEKLVSAERLAAVGKITATVAHELNNPLDGIMRYISLGMRIVEEDPSKAKRYMTECRQGLLRMSNTLTQLLAFSRSKRRSTRPVPINQTIRDCVSLYEERMKENKIELDMDVPQDLPVSRVPELFEALSNVIKNALDAMGEEGALNITAAPEDSDVRIHVSDTGPGIPEENQEKVFEPFFTTKTEGTSTGLGLALCRDALRRMGGEIELLPSEKGAQFEITVPAQSRDNYE